jgi:diguanylate cyclase (GGDEF)-like protein/PAS domain S-box-containing protein
MRDTVPALASLLDILPDTVIVVDDKGDILLANSATRTLLGYESQELAGQPVALLVPERFRQAHQRYVQEFGKQGEPKSMGTRPILFAFHKSGAEVPVTISLCGLEIAGRRCSVAVLRDASRFREHMDRILAQAEQDPLTGLANRLYLMRRLESAAAVGGSFAVLFLDLARFKPFNDQYGHKVGDAVLLAVAQRIKATIRATDTAARLGGDEFVVVVEGLTDPEQLAARAFAIAESVIRPIQIGPTVAEVGVNIGGALYPLHATGVDELLEKADQAMYRAKQSKQTYQLFGREPPTDRAA